MNVIQSILVMTILATCIVTRRSIVVARIITFPDIFSTPPNFIRQDQEQEQRKCPGDTKCDGYPPLIIKPVIIKLYRYPDIDNNKTKTQKNIETSKPHNLTNLETIYFKSELFITVLYGLIKLASQSIAGITYMDEHDFSQRYRNVYECDPFYWHPLHLPEHCMKMFEELIRSGIGRLGRTRVVKERRGPYFNFEDLDLNDDTMAPYEKMVELLKKDVVREPTEGEITFFPGLGAAALYNQPVSRKSGDYMKAVAKAYKDISFAFGPLYNPIEELTTKKPGNKDKKEEINEFLKSFDFDREHLRNSEHKNKPKYNIKKKLHKGGLVTVLRTKHNR